MITQGPWKWHKRKHSNTHFLANESETNDDFAIIDDGSAYGEYGAVIDVNGGNAQLIAAAPELLEALQFIQSKMSDFINLANNVGINDADGFYLAAATDAQQKAQAAINKALGEKQ